MLDTIMAVEGLKCEYYDTVDKRNPYWTDLFRMGMDVDNNLHIW